MATKTSMCSISSTRTGLTQSSCSSVPSAKSVSLRPSSAIRVADQARGQPGRGSPAELGEARAGRAGKRPADLLVEEDVPREAVDLVVEAEGDLAEHPGRLIHVEHRLEVVPAPCRLGPHDPPALEPQPQVLDLVLLVDRREREADLALAPILDRAGENLSVGHVPLPAAGPPAAPRRD